METIYLYNGSTLLEPTSLEVMLPALQEQVDRDFAPLWGVRANLIIAETEPLGEPRVLLVDRCGESNDLGFHIDQAGVPVARVGVGDAMGYAIPVSTVVSHELLEMLADPSATRMTGQYIVEVCDPVSEDYYSIGPIQVANFCTPRYFGYTGMGHYDQLGLLQAGLPDVRPGGMVMWYNGTNWATTMGRTIAGHLPWRAHLFGRNSHRAGANAHSSR